MNVGDDGGCIMDQRTQRKMSGAQHGECDDNKNVKRKRKKLLPECELQWERELTCMRNSTTRKVRASLEEHVEKQKNEHIVMRGDGHENVQLSFLRNYKRNYR